MLCHNGEINTRRGNVNWMAAREAELEANEWGADIDLLKPIIQPGGSDSAELDNALEALVLSGRNLLGAMTMLVPPAWTSDKRMSQQLKDFYEFHACLNEPWDGPACLVFTDGSTVSTMILSMRGGRAGRTGRNGVRCCLLRWNSCSGRSGSSWRRSLSSLCWSCSRSWTITWSNRILPASASRTTTTTTAHLPNTGSKIKINVYCNFVHWTYNVEQCMAILYTNTKRCYFRLYCCT
jgi:hypothetical protein